MQGNESIIDNGYGETGLWCLIRKQVILDSSGQRACYSF